MQTSNGQQRISETDMHKQPCLESPLQSVVIVQVITTTHQGEKLFAGFALGLGKIPINFGQLRQ